MSDAYPKATKAKGDTAIDDCKRGGESPNMPSPKRESLGVYDETPKDMALSPLTQKAPLNGDYKVSAEDKR